MVRMAGNGGGNPWGDDGERTTVQSFFSRLSLVTKII